MKYSMDRVKAEETDFKPFIIKIIFETKEEYVDFHNNVAGQITGGSHKFIGDLYRMGKNEQEQATGTIKKQHS